MFKTMNALATALILGLSTVGCATTGAPDADRAEAARAASEVRVTNNNWSDMVVYAVRSGLRRRLGTVTSMTSASFEVSAAMIRPGGELRLLADPIGSGDAYLSRPVMLNPGQSIGWTVQNHLALSHFSVW